tara:strand:+ start:421 stop:1146 length:726 start_codon:yes stop_codon:yes gene_type:complete
MILCIDIGNSNIVYALWNGNAFINIQRIETGESDIEVLNNIEISQVAITSVVPKLTNYYSNYFNQKLNISPFIVNHSNCQIHLDVEAPKDVGPDRICNVYGVREKYGFPAIVIDFGSATTYDVINVKGDFIGGAIAPGIDVSANYLIQKAALLKSTAFKFPDTVIGKNTETNLQSGIMYGGLDSVEGMVDRIKNELNINDVKVILTGGFSSIISDKLSIKHCLDKTITLLGLKLIFDYNQS